MKHQCVILTVLLAVLAASGNLWALPTTPYEAEMVVTGWLKANPQPLGMPLGLLLAQGIQPLLQKFLRGGTQSAQAGTVSANTANRVRRGLRYPDSAAPAGADAPPGTLHHPTKVLYSFFMPAFRSIPIPKRS